MLARECQSCALRDMNDQIMWEGAAPEDSAGAAHVALFRHRHNHAAQKLTPFLLTVHSPATQDGYHLRTYLGQTTPIHPPGAARFLTKPDVASHQLLVVSCCRWPTISSALPTRQHFWQKCINIANASCIFCSAHVLIALLSNAIGNFFANSKE